MNHEVVGKKTENNSTKKTFQDFFGEILLKINFFPNKVPIIYANVLLTQVSIYKTINMYGLYCFVGTLSKNNKKTR